MPPREASFRHDARGATLVEFALIAPVLGALLFGMLGFGQLFWISHSVQQIANDAARATVAGLTVRERSDLAQASARHALASADGVKAQRLTLTVGEAAPWVTVTARYDASDIAILRTGLVPMPEAMLERRATVRMGGGA